MRAVRISRRFNAELFRRTQLVWRTTWKAGEFGERDDTVGTRNPHGPIHDFQVACRSFQSIRSDLLDLLCEFLGRAVDRNAADRNGTRATRARSAFDFDLYPPKITRMRSGGRSRRSAIS